MAATAFVDHNGNGMKMCLGLLRNPVVGPVLIKRLKNDEPI